MISTEQTETFIYSLEDIIRNPKKSQQDVNSIESYTMIVTDFESTDAQSTNEI